MHSCLAIVLILIASRVSAAGSPPDRSSQEYAAQLWKHLHSPLASYTKWRPDLSSAVPEMGPKLSGKTKTYLNSVAAKSPEVLPHGSMVVVEQLDASDKIRSLLVRFRVLPDYDPANQDWYWGYFTAAGDLIESSLDRNAFTKPGFIAVEEDGRLWVFRSSSKELLEYRKKGELAKHVIRPGAGPRGMTLKAPDADTLAGYCVAKKGFDTRIVDGRLWVFAAGSKELGQFEKTGELAKHVVRPSAGPLGMTIKAPDVETIDSYLLGKDGFVTFLEDGRLWVFRSGAKELTEFQKNKELAKHVVLPGAGQHGITIKSPDRDTAAAYLASREGFRTILADGRLWVFKSGTKDLADFQKHGELAKHLVRPSAGPLGLTLKGPDAETLDAYQQSQK